MILVPKHRVRESGYILSVFFNMQPDKPASDEGQRESVESLNNYIMTVLYKLFGIKKNGARDRSRSCTPSGNQLSRLAPLPIQSHGLYFCYDVSLDDS